MGLNRLRDCEGVSLVEVMISLVVLLLVFVGLFQSAILGIDSNMQNLLRDEAVTIAATRMEEARNMPFEQVVSDTADAIEDDNLVLPFCNNVPDEEAKPPYPVEVKRTFRNIQDFPFGTRRVVTDHGADTKIVEIWVCWEYKDECKTHRATTVRRR